MADPRWTLCPRCGSFDIHGDHLTPLGQRHKCKNCGYVGSFVVEADTREDAERIRAEIQADYEGPEGVEREDPSG